MIFELPGDAFFLVAGIAVHVLMCLGLPSSTLEET